MKTILINCRYCLADRHDKCTGNFCLCETETDHNQKKLGGKTNWEKTGIELEYNKFFFENIDEMLHGLICNYKGQDKSCLIKNKSKGMNQE